MSGPTCEHGYGGAHQLITDPEGPNPISWADCPGPVTSPVVSGAQGDGGRMDDETLSAGLADIYRCVNELRCVPAPISVRDVINGVHSLRSDLRAARRELGDTRARLAAAEALAEEWRNVTPAGFYPEASAHANAVENCGDALIDLLSEPAAALGATDQAPETGDAE